MQRKVFCTGEAEEFFVFPTAKSLKTTGRFCATYWFLQIPREHLKKLYFYYIITYKVSLFKKFQKKILPTQKLGVGKI